MTTKTIRWVIAHEPIYLFEECAEHFSKEVYEKTNGEFKIEVLSLTDYGKKYNNGIPVTRYDLIKLLEENKVEFSQMYSFTLGYYNNDYWALEMPFLFKNHDHVDAVLEGEVGEEILEGLSKKNSLKGLAFTYSGGYKCLPIKDAIQSLSDLKNKTIRVNDSPVAKDIFSSLGANAVIGDVDKAIEEGAKGTYFGSESTYVRVQHTQNQKEGFGAILESEYSLFSTSIIASDKFWNNLTDEHKDIIKKAAINAAKKERIRSIEVGEQIKKECGTRDISLVEFKDKERKEWKEKTDWMYEKYENVFTEGLLEKIKNIKH